MEAKKQYHEEIEFGQELKVSIDQGTLVVSGPKGEARKKLVHPRLTLKVEEGKIVLDTIGFSKRDKVMRGTFVSHIKNLIRGAKEGYVYKLKICSGHFPMNVSVANNVLTIKNFIGEKVPRVLKLKPGVEVKIEGDDITVESVDKELAGQTAGSIEKLTRRSGFDKRIFQQGIYITQKP